MFLLTHLSGDDQGLEWSRDVEMGGQRRHLRHLPRRLRRLLSRLQVARGRLPPRLGTGMKLEFDETLKYIFGQSVNGAKMLLFVHQTLPHAVHPLLPHPLHHEVAQLAAGPAPLPHVQAGVEVQRVKEGTIVFIRLQQVICNKCPNLV